MSSESMNENIVNIFWLFVFVMNFLIGKHQCAFYIGKILPNNLEFSDANGWMLLEVRIFKSSHSFMHRSSK